MMNPLNAAITQLPTGQLTRNTTSKTLHSKATILSDIEVSEDTILRSMHESHVAITQYIIYYTTTYMDCNNIMTLTQDTISALTTQP